MLLKVCFFYLSTHWHNNSTQKSSDLDAFQMKRHCHESHFYHPLVFFSHSSLVSFLCFIVFFAFCSFQTASWKLKTVQSPGVQMFLITSPLFARPALWTGVQQHNRFIISCARTWNSFVFGGLWTLSDSTGFYIFFFIVFETIIQTTNHRFSNCWHTGLWAESLPAL